MSVLDAAGSDDEGELLAALRDAIAEAIDAGVPARDLASLSRRLMEIRKEIAALDALEEKDGGGAADTEDEEWDEEF